MPDRFLLGVDRVCGAFFPLFASDRACSLALCDWDCERVCPWFRAAGAGNHIGCVLSEDCRTFRVVSVGHRTYAAPSEGWNYIYGGLVIFRHFGGIFEELRIWICICGELWDLITILYGGRWTLLVIG